MTVQSNHGWLLELWAWRMFNPDRLCMKSEKLGSIFRLDNFLNFCFIRENIHTLMPFALFLQAILKSKILAIPIALERVQQFFLFGCSLVKVLMKIAVPVRSFSYSNNRNTPTRIETTQAKFKLFSEFGFFTSGRPINFSRRALITV